MSIKFPDFQVLVTRTDQIPKLQREGEQSGAGKLAPQVHQEIEERKKKVTENPNSHDVRKRKEKEEKGSDGKSKSKKGQKRGRHIDIRA